MNRLSATLSATANLLTRVRTFLTHWPAASSSAPLTPPVLSPPVSNASTSTSSSTFTIRRSVSKDSQPVTMLNSAPVTLPHLATSTETIADPIAQRLTVLPLSATSLTPEQISAAHALLLRCALTREPLVACLRARFSSEEIEKAYTHYIDAVMKRCLQRRPQALSTVAIDQDTNQVVGVLINDLLEDPALPLDSKLLTPMQPILRVLAQLDNAYVRYDRKPAGVSDQIETIVTAAPKKKTFSLTSSSESLLHYYPTKKTLRLLLSAIDNVSSNQPATDSKTDSRCAVLSALVQHAVQMAKSLKFATIMGETTSATSNAACLRAGFKVRAQVDLTTFEYEGQCLFAPVCFDAAGVSNDDHMLKLVVMNL